MVEIHEEKLEADGTMSFRVSLASEDPLERLEVWMTKAELLYEEDEEGLGTVVSWDAIHYAAWWPAVSLEEDLLDTYQDALLDVVRARLLA